MNLGGTPGAPPEGVLPPLDSPNLLILEQVLRIHLICRATAGLANTLSPTKVLSTLPHNVKNRIGSDPLPVYK